MTIIRSTELQLPNMSLCLSGFHDLPMNIVWSPEIDSTANGPSWIYKLSLYVELELRLMNALYGNVLSAEWRYYTFIYVEAYVRALLSIEMNGAEIVPWYEDFERYVLKTFNKYNVTTKQLIEKYASELFRVSKCASSWPEDTKYTVWPFIDNQKPNERCLYVSVQITIDQTISNRKKDDIFLHNCHYDAYHAPLIDETLDLLPLNQQPETTINPFNKDTVEDGKREKNNVCKGYDDRMICDECIGPDIFSCGDGRCIPKSWRCDNNQNCATNADEANCTKIDIVNATLHCCGYSGKDPCQPSRLCDGIIDCTYTFEDELNCTTCAGFACGDGQCISPRYRCDGKRDNERPYLGLNPVFLNDYCLNGADERSCDTVLDKCPEYENGFRCANGICLPSEQRCNNEDDCGDLSDEQNCRRYGYPDVCSDLIKCEDTFSSCYTSAQRCDARYDCYNSHDELNCTTCETPMKRCNMTRENGDLICYGSDRECDGNDDCGDGTDEQNCCHTFECDNGTTCVPDNARCNTTFECKDKSDEFGCTVVSGGFDCGSNYHIDHKLKCNGVTDCPDMRDELNCPTNISTNNICDAIKFLLPKCENYNAGWSPMAHGGNCRMNKLPWRMRSSFAALKQTNQADILCDGVQNCVNGIDELAYICGNYQLAVAEVKPSYMILAVFPGSAKEVPTTQVPTTQSPTTESAAEETDDTPAPETPTTETPTTEIQTTELPTTETTTEETDPGDLYYGVSIPVSFTDCIEACVYLSGDNKTFIDIGLSYTVDENMIWVGTCTALFYYSEDNRCELISDIECTQEQIDKNIVSEQYRVTRIFYS